MSFALAFSSLKSSLGPNMDVAVLLISNVSGSENDRSVRKTLVKAICNTINMMRLFMNICDIHVYKVTGASSIEVTKTGCNNNISLRCLSNGAKVRIVGFKYQFFQMYGLSCMQVHCVG